MLAQSALLALASLATASAAPLYRRAASSDLESLCSVSNIQDALPANGTLNGISFVTDSVTANLIEVGDNLTSSSGGQGGNGKSSSQSEYNYCNVTLEYVHTGTDYTVVLNFAFPDPQDFTNRYYSAGGGGYALSSSPTSGLQYGAVSGASDAGYGGFDGVGLDDVILAGNGTIDWEPVHMFAYKALGELVQIGKNLTRSLYEMEDEEKLYTYFEGCSDGGREGMSQAQRFGSEYDGIISGAPAMRMALQQVGHVVPALYEYVLDYFPEPCALDKIVNLTIEACDGLDGRKDGVISRTDLCKLEFNLSSLIGESYSCAAANSSSLGFGFSKRADASTSTTTPAQNGTISEMDITIASMVWDGLHNNAGQRAYLGWQVGSELSDAETVYNSETGEWEYDVQATGGSWITKFLQLVDVDNLDSLEGFDYDDAVAWMQQGLIRYWDTLLTTFPDLTEFQSTGGKLLHYHGESDPSVPAASSVHYWQSVKDTMYGNLTETGQLEALKEWYHLYFIPGYAHCGANSLQPGPAPADNMAVMIDWVENGNAPDGLNSTVSSGTYAGETQMLCQFPYRPLWSGNDTTSFECVYHESSYESWTFTFDAFQLPIW